MLLEKTPSTIVFGVVEKFVGNPVALREFLNQKGIPSDMRKTVRTLVKAAEKNRASEDSN